MSAASSAAPAARRRRGHRASRSDHLTARQIVWVRAGEVAQVELKLPPVERPGPGTPVLELRDESGGPGARHRHPVAGRPGVELSPQPGGLLTRRPAGPWTLRVDANGWLVARTNRRAVSGGEQRLSLTLLRPCRATGAAGRRAPAQRAAGVRAGNGGAVSGRCASTR